MVTDIGKDRAVRERPATDAESGSPSDWQQRSYEPDRGGRRPAFLAPDVPELLELVGTVERLLLDVADTGLAGPPHVVDDELFEPGSWWAWLVLAAMAAAGAPTPPLSTPSPASEVREEAFGALWSLRRALAPALHLDQAAARPYWRGPDRRRLVAFRLVVVDQNTLDALTLASRRLRFGRADERDDLAALECLLAVLIPLDDHDPEPSVLAASATFAGAVDENVAHEVVLDQRAHEAYHHVAARLVDALHRLQDQDVAGRPTSPSRDREDEP
jgi:hypothetical protein